MKTLSSTLLAAQRSASSRPYVEAKVADYWGAVRKLRLTRHYTSSEAAGYVAAAIAPDGSLVRARLQDNGATSTFYVSRVASPGAGSTYSSWTSLEAGVSDQAGVALARVGSALWLFYVASDDVSIRRRVSSDNGATWGSATTILTARAAVGAIAAAPSTGGDVLLVWNEGATVYRSRYTSGGGFGTRTAWTRSVASVTGLAVSYSLDWQVCVCGAEVTTLKPKVYALLYGNDFDQPADTWSVLREVMGAEAGSGVSFSSPATVQAFGHRLFFVESYSGDASYDRLQYATMASTSDFNDEHWREPLPFDYEGNAYGAAVAYDGSSVIWLVTVDGVWSSALPAYAEVDLTADVLEARVDQDAGGARVELVLDNSAGAYDGYGSGSLGALQRGARLQLTPGYRTSAGDEIAAPYVYWVESIERLTFRQAQGERGKKLAVLRARDGWRLLERWRARRQFVWAAGERTVQTILGTLAYRAGLPFGPHGDSALAFYPAFTLQAGESGATAVRRLLAMGGDVGYFSDEVFQVTLPAGNDTSTYSLGVDHAVTAARYRDVGPAVNRARVVGNGVYAEAFDFAEIASVGELVAQVVDRNLGDSGDAADRASAVLRDAAIGALGDEVTLFGVHCGVELYDVVDLTDDQAGLSAAPRRVLGVSWRYSTGTRPRYDMTLMLGAV